jgi:hypothetical protein
VKKKRVKKAKGNKASGLIPLKIPWRHHFECYRDVSTIIALRSSVGENHANSSGTEASPYPVPLISVASRNPL